MPRTHYPQHVDLILRPLTRIAQGTIDMKSWRGQPSFSTQDAAAPDLPSPPSTDISEGAESPADDPSEPGTADSSHTQMTAPTKRRKIVGGLRLAEAVVRQPSSPGVSSPESARRLQPNTNSIPQRKRNHDATTPASRPYSGERLVQGIWEQIYGPVRFNCERYSKLDPAGATFRDVSTLCLRVSQASQHCRSLETIVQAHWVECFDAKVETVIQQQGATSQTKARKLVLGEACRGFEWSEKYLRNKM